MNSLSYDASAFYPDFPKGRSSGELRIDAGGVTFDGSGLRVSLPFDGLSVTLGGASDRLVFFEHPNFPQWSIHTTALQVLHDPQLRAHPPLLAAINRLRGKRRRARTLLLAAVLLIVAVPVMIAMNMHVLTAIAARQVPVTWEEKIGASAFAQYRLGHELIDNPAALAALRELTQPLTEVAGIRYPFEFHIVRDSGLNAFALPGGIVVVNSGLIERASSAPELLGVLAHEISHVSERHGVRNVISAGGVAITLQLLIGDSSGLLATLAGAAPVLLSQSYSRDFERDADRRGVALLRAANVDPHGMESFFRKIIEHEKKLRAQIGNADAAAALETLSRFLGSHPATEERIDRIRGLTADSRGPYRDLQVTFAQLQTLVSSGTAPTHADQKDSGDVDPH